MFDLKLGLVFVLLLGIVGLFVCLFLSVASFLFSGIVSLLIFRRCEFLGVISLVVFRRCRLAFLFLSILGLACVRLFFAKNCVPCCRCKLPK